MCGCWGVGGGGGGGRSVIFGFVSGGLEGGHVNKKQPSGDLITVSSVRFCDQYLLSAFNFHCF